MHPLMDAWGVGGESRKSKKGKNSLPEKYTMSLVGFKALS